MSRNKQFASLKIIIGYGDLCDQFKNAAVHHRWDIVLCKDLFFISSFERK